MPLNKTLGCATEARAKTGARAKAAKNLVSVRSERRQKKYASLNTHQKENYAVTALFTLSQDQLADVERLNAKLQASRKVK